MQNVHSSVCVCVCVCVCVFTHGSWFWDHMVSEIQCSFSFRQKKCELDTECYSFIGQHLWPVLGQILIKKT